ncbi:HAMP domain-containing methyl-accepting chemotaxis protein [Ohtaekwangia sp.]|uniref:HAMP domain-containing methyl-accepting chemotaxis protein n=1 Tax=Ohtaekwangia sp. TaxID=2066019 RepID=UPI002FDDE967
MLNKLTIRNKLILAFAALIVLMTVIFIMSFIRIGNMNERISAVMNGTVTQLSSITKIRQMVNRIMRDQKKIIIASDDREMSELARGIELSINRANDEFEVLKSLSKGELGRTAAQMEIKYNDFLKTNNEIIKLAFENTENVAKRRLFTEGYADFIKVNSTLEELISEVNLRGSKEQLRELSHIRDLFATLYNEEKTMILAGGAAQRELVIKEAADVENELELAITRLGKITTGQLGVLLDKYNRQYSTFYTVHKEIMDLAYRATNSLALDISNKSGDEAGAELTKLIDIYLDIVNQQLAREGEETAAMYHNSIQIMSIIVFAAITISVLMGLWLLRGIMTSLNIATGAVKKLSAGDFSADVKITTEDEIGLVLMELQRMIEKLRGSVQIAKRVSGGDLMIDFKQRKDHGGELDEALEQMVTNLRNIATTIYNGADNVTAASQQVASASQQMSQGAQEQASASEEVSSSMEQMAANILQNTDNSRETEKISNKALQDIQEGSRSVSEAVDAITMIADKIAIIEEIASKTDLLALNAAVEAARAGEHGKGFAVVAAEVRKLAERSQKAAAEINEISARTVKQAKESKELLLNTLPDIGKTAALVQEIAAASVEQNLGASQVNKAIQQLSQVTQGNASAAEEMSSNAEELSSQAEELKAAISYFKIDVDGRNTKNMRNAKKGYSVNQFRQRIPMHNGGVDLKLDDSVRDQEFTEF